VYPICIFGIIQFVSGEKYIKKNMEIPFFDLEVLKKFEKEFPHRI
jgi:hypothetical protein